MRTTTRRSLTASALLATLLGAAFTLPASAQAQEAATTTTAPVPARAAEDFVQSVGVATHLTYTDTTYRNYGLLAQRIEQLGIKHLRDGWGTGSAYASDFVREVLGPMGVKITMVQDPRLNATPVQLKDMIKNQLLPVIAGVESLNEPDTQGPGWSTRARDWTIQVSQAFRGDPVTAGIPLIGPSMADTLNTANHRSMGDLSPYLDYGNTHDYPGDAFQMTDRIVDIVKANVGEMVPGKPIQATETGFSNGRLEAPYPATPEAQAAVLMPRLYLDHFRRGIARTFTYELVDEWPDDKFESRFGLLRNDLSPKPAFHTMAALTSLLADPGPAFTPGTLEYGLTGTDAATRTQLLQKRDGSYWLAVWQQSKVWDGTQVLTPPALPLTLTLASPAAEATTYRLGTGKTPQGSVQGATRIPVTSSAEVTLVRLTGLAGAATSATTSVAAPTAAPSPSPVVTSSPVAAPTSPLGRTKGGGKSRTQSGTTSGTTFVSDTAWRATANGWGPAERDMANGETAAGDGHTLALAGRRFAKGLGVHAPSAVTVPVNGAHTFRASIGVDDETFGRGSVVFQVWADGVKLYESPRVTGGQPARAVSVPVTGRRQLRLVVTDAGDDPDDDHADWADAVLVSSIPAATSVRRLPAGPSRLTATSRLATRTGLGLR